MDDILATAQRPLTFGPLGLHASYRPRSLPDGWDSWHELAAHYVTRPVTDNEADYVKAVFQHGSAAKQAEWLNQAETNRSVASYFAPQIADCNEAHAALRRTLAEQAADEREREKQLAAAERLEDDADAVRCNPSLYQVINLRHNVESRTLLPAMERAGQRGRSRVADRSHVAPGRSVARPRERRDNRQSARSSRSGRGSPDDEPHAGPRLDGPALVEWLEARKRTSWLGGEKDAQRRVRRCRDGASISVRVAEPLLARMGLLLSDVPERIFLGKRPAPQPPAQRELLRRAA